METRQGLWPVMASLVCLSLAACGAVAGGSAKISEAPETYGPPAALNEQRALFFAGEQMTFELSLRGITGGEATVAVGEPGTIDGRSQIIVRSRVESAGVAAIFKEVRDEITTSIDLATARPIAHRAQVKFGDKESIIETQFAGGAVGSFELDYARKGAEPRRLRQAMPSDQAAFDMHSAIGAIRAWAPVDGEHVFFYALAGRQLWQLTLRMTGREPVKTKLGRYPALRIDGVARRVTRDLRADPRRPARHFTVWLSDDASRLPLVTEGKTEYGDVKAELVDYQRPDTAVAKAAR
jgi:hypothetical protein